MKNVIIATEQNTNRTVFYAHCTCTFKRISSNEFFTDTLDLCGKIGNTTLTKETELTDELTEKIERTLKKVFKNDDVRLLCLDTVTLECELRQQSLAEFLEYSHVVDNYR